MQKRQLGSTDLLVSEIGLGTTGIGGHNLFLNIDEVESMATLYRALDEGINFFDTADFYGPGRSEELVGKIVKKRDAEVIISSKGGLKWDENGRFLERDNHPDYLRQALEASLRRLQRDCLDLYIMHAVDIRVPLEESYGALMRFREEGKIRYAGLANVTRLQVERARQAGPVSVVQNQYSIFDRRPEITGLLEYCHEKGIGFLTYGSLAFGILGGKYRRDFRLPEQDWRRRIPLFSHRYYPHISAITRQLREQVEIRGALLPHLAQQWVLRRKEVSCCVTGAKRPDQVSQNIASAEFDLRPEDVALIDELTAELNIEQPRRVLEPDRVVTKYRLR